MFRALSTVTMLLFLAFPAQGAVLCDPIEKVKEVLLKDHKEVPIGHGIGGNGQYRIILFVSLDTIGQSFTIVWHTPDEKGCIIASGTDFELFMDETNRLNDGGI